MSKGTIVGNSYVPPYAGDYNKLQWYEKDLMTYFDYINYNEMADILTKYFRDKRVVNFDIIYHECRGDKLDKSYKHYKTINQKELKKYPENEKNKVLSEGFRSIKRDDLWIQRDLMLEYFKKNF